MTPALQNARSVVIRFAYTNQGLIPPPYYVRKDIWRGTPFYGEPTRASVMDVFHELVKDDFVLVDVRTAKVWYASGANQYETQFFFRNGGIPRTERWEGMRNAFFALAAPLSWQTKLWYDERRERFNALCERPRLITKAKGPTPMMHTGDALLYDKI